MNTLLEPVWIWGILGLVLLAIEMLTGTLYVLWFAVAAIFLSALTYGVPNLSLPWQLLLFSALSLSAVAVLRLRDRKKPTLRIGQSAGDEIGKTGIITQAVTPFKNGEITFAQGILGSRTWEAIADEDIAQGASAFIVAVEGNRLRVSVHPPKEAHPFIEGK